MVNEWGNCSVDHMQGLIGVGPIEFIKYFYNFIIIIINYLIYKLYTKKLIFMQHVASSMISKLIFKKYIKIIKSYFFWLIVNTCWDEGQIRNFRIWKQSWPLVGVIEGAEKDKEGIDFFFFFFF